MNKINKNSVPSKYVCKICNKSYVHQSSLDKHIKVCRAPKIKITYDMIKQTEINDLSYQIDTTQENLKSDNLNIQILDNNILSNSCSSNSSNNDLLLDDKLIQLIKENFNETDNELFKMSFNLFNQNYNSKDDFIINLDDVYKWMGFSRKDPAKRLLVNNFIKDRDYKIIILNYYYKIITEKYSNNIYYLINII